MKVRVTFTAILLLVLLSASTRTIPSVKAEAETDILTRINKNMEWLQAHKTVTTLGAYYSHTSEDNAIIDVAGNSAVAYMFTMYTKLMPTRKNLPEILELLNFILNAKKGEYFYPYYNTSGRGWISKPQPYHKNSEILQNLAFISFHLRLESQILTEDEKELLDEIVESLESLVDELAKTSSTGNGAWKFKYTNEDFEAKLRENSEVLVALLHIAAYESRWGSLEQADSYRKYLQETARWILEMQERNPPQWGYGGFYETEEKSNQSTISNAIAIFSLTTYLRLISLLDESPDPTIQEVREAIILWEENFMNRMVDEYGGPHQARDKNGVKEYPKELLAASLSLRAMAETWVVHGDSKYRRWCITIYEWITGENEARKDLQSDDGFYLNGFPTLNILGGTADIASNAYTTASLIYAEWINIPEFSRQTLYPLLTLILLIGIKLVNRASQGRAQTDRQPLKPQPMNPSSPY